MDVWKTLKGSGNTIPGPAGICYKNIFDLTDDDIKELANKFNGSLRYGEIRETSLHNYQMPLPKPNKDLSMIGSYRITTLQNTTGKLLEKQLIASRLTDDLDRRPLFHPHWEGGGGETVAE